MSSASSEKETWTLDKVDSSPASLPGTPPSPQQLYFGRWGHGLKRVTGHKPQAVGLLQAEMQSKGILG